MSGHAFESRPVSTCSRCGLIRVRRTSGCRYADDTESQVWWSEDDAPACATDEQLQALIEDDWRTRPIVMFDVETSGLDWTHDFVTEVSAVCGLLTLRDENDPSQGFKAVTTLTFVTLVKPPPGFDPEEAAAMVATTSKITGITSEMIAKDGVEAAAAAAGLAHAVALAGPRALGASYNTTFDQPFLAALFLRAGLRVPDLLAPSRPLLDPYRWIQSLDRYVKGSGRHKLAATAMRHGILTEDGAEGAHRADFDATLALHLAAKLAGAVPADLDDLRDYQRAARGEWGANFFGKYLPSQRRMERIQRIMRPAAEPPQKDESLEDSEESLFGDA